VSYADVFSLNLLREHDEAVAAGDLVCTGPSLFPQYKVIAVHGDKVWLRNVQNGWDAVADLKRCRRIGR
jgi:hypothetical protein